VDNLEEANRQWLLLIFPLFEKKFIKKILEFSVKLQWVDFTAFHIFLNSQTVFSETIVYRL
jgi:hypothetical protein